MKLDKEQLHEIFRNSASLNEFLLACADVYYDGYYDGGYEIGCDIDDLPESELIKLFDWWKEKHSKQKYTIQLLPNKQGFLNRDSDGNFMTSSDEDVFEYQTHFTKQEIEQLKQLDDLAIDWDKAKIEPVEDNEDED